MARETRYWILFLTLGCSFIFTTVMSSAQQHIVLTFDSAVNITMQNSYRIKQLQLGIERTRYRLQANRAALKSKVYLNLKSPEYDSVSDYKWNSTLQRDEIIHLNTNLWQMDLSVRQPVVLLGYPTNGYLSLNNKVYRYLQKTDGDTDIKYYNRHFVKFEQPLFRPNSLKNNIEDSELDLEENELDYLSDQINIIDDIADDYYDLFELAYMNEIYSHEVENLEIINSIAAESANRDSNRSIEAIQAKIEYANAREKLLKNQSDIRLELSRMKQRLRMSDIDSLSIGELDVRIRPVDIDIERAIQYGYTLRPRLRLLNIRKRKNQININNAEGWDAFYMNLEMTYGLEKQNEDYEELIHDYDNSYSVSVNAYIPIWDWGRRKARIEAERINLKRTELYIEESRNQIRSDIINAVANLNEYQSRALNLQNNLDAVYEITEISIEQYRNGEITFNDILQVIVRARETEINFLNAFLGYKNSLINLMINTYYDYERDVPLIDRFLDS